MEYKSFRIEDLAGNAVPGATVNVYLTGTTTHATGLQNFEGGAVTSPFTADAVTGKVGFRAPNGTYDIVMVRGDFQDALYGTEFFDIEDANIDRTGRYDSLQALLDSTDPARGEGKVWQGGTRLFTEAAADASGYHETTAGGVGLFEAGDRFTTRERAESGDTLGSDVIYIGDLAFGFDPSGTALTTGDGRAWRPAGEGSIYHWGITGSGDETTKLQAALTWAAAGNKLVGDNITVTVSESVVMSEPSEATVDFRGLTISVDAGSWTGGDNVVDITAPTDCKFFGPLEIDGNGAGDHGFAVTDPVRTYVDFVNAHDLTGTGVIFFPNLLSDPEAMPGNVAANCSTSDTQHGVIFEDMADSHIVDCHAKNFDGFGLNFKGNMTRSTMTGSARDGGASSGFGVAFSSDVSGAGTGAIDCKADVIITGCDRGVSIVRAARSEVVASVDMEDAGGVAAEMGADNDHCQMRLKLHNINTTSAAVETRSNDNFVMVDYWDGTGLRLWNVTSAQRQRMVLVNHGLATDPASAVLDTSGQTNNRFISLRDLEGRTDGKATEGTYAPAFANGSFTMGAQAGRYTKIGRLMHVYGRITWSANSTGTPTNAQITLPSGWPATSANAHFGGSVGYCNGVDNEGGKQIVLALSQNGTSIDVRLAEDNAAFDFSDLQNWSASGEVRFSIAYEVE